ncbi:AAA family ATPase [Microbispora sp. NEAU-D428]|uniref:helix-turn-helix transcriptional regulator n=1 Tax=Microbispora sitophila TaxID=2771537 RepID=UPI00186847DD|nr:LuxR family transcriptional regulator [Microbispora sitophila]MBE3014803.1 AAA family ATPase [Microbispora sitophila]
MLERESELSAIFDGVTRARAGRSTFFAVMGAAGIGKTRLIEEARRTAAENGLRVLAAKASPLERGYAFGLVRQLFESVLIRADEAERERLLSGAASEVRPLFEPTGRGGAPRSEMAVFHGLFWLTANLCDIGPVLLAVDDLHWADEASLRSLAYLQLRLDDVGLVVVAGTRPSDPLAARDLLDVLLTHPECRTLWPKPLSVQATGAVLEEILGHTPNPQLVSACHAATVGTPLLLMEMGRALRREQSGSRDLENMRIDDVGGKAIARRVSVELVRLSKAGRRIAETVAILGRQADLGRLATLAQLEPETVHRGISELDDAHILRRAPGQRAAVEFVHPLVRSAVYEQMDPSDRAGRHLEAAELLIQEGRRPEEPAIHLLALPFPAAGHLVVLRQAARQALDRGAPESAHAYLAHALTANVPPKERLDLLKEAITTALLVDVKLATDHLESALQLSEDPVETGELLCMAGLAKSWIGRGDEMAKQLAEAIERLPDDADDLRRGLEALLLDIPLVADGFGDLRTRMPALRRLPRSESLNAAFLECMIAGNECYAGDPRGLERARAALRHPGMPAAAAMGASAGIVGHFTLIVGDIEQGIDAYGVVVEEARRHGSTVALGISLTYRAMGWLRGGELAEAEADLREVFQMDRLSPMGIVLGIARGLLAEVLVEQGKIDEAGALLDEEELPAKLPQAGILHFTLHARAKLLSAQGLTERALEAALVTGERFAGHNGANPAIVAWRSEAALSLYALGNAAGAQAYAREEVELAERWGAPYAIGRAVRVAGLVAPMPEALTLLERSVDVLRPTTARLELAYSLVALGACRRRMGHLAAARPLLYEGMELAQRCQAAPLVKEARGHLAAAGARPRRSYVSGPESLTPSESRVARLAAEGFTNSQIAQRLYIQVKTVEVHLSSVYRKLGVTRRQQLTSMLAGSGQT